LSNTIGNSCGIEAEQGQTSTTFLFGQDANFRSLGIQPEVNMSAVFLSYGCIDFPVEAAWDESLFATLEVAGHIWLPPPCRDDLQQLRSSWLERRSMTRPAYGRVRAMLNKLCMAEAKGNTDRFLTLMSDYATQSREGCPNAEFVYETLDYELRTKFGAGWGDDLRAGWRKVHDVRHTIAGVRDNLSAHYRGRKGSSRDHDLGWVIYRLAQIYQRAGGRVTAWTDMDLRSSAYNAPYVTSSNFIEFVEVFIDHLPSRPHVDVGNLVKRALPELKGQQDTAPRKRRGLTENKENKTIR
jgi:hypothetical protein